MGRFLLKDVYAAFKTRFEHMETGIDARFGQTKTAIKKVEDEVQRRIDLLDDRMDEFFKKVKDRHGANSSSDDTP